MFHLTARCAGQRQRSSIQIFTSLRNYATRTPRPKMPTPRPTAIPLKPKTAPNIERMIDRVHYQKLDKLYQEGKQVLFTAAPQKAFITAAWSIALAAGLGTFAIVNLEAWNYTTLINRKVKLAWLVAGTNLVVLLMAGFVAGFCFLRPSNFILSIKLVQRSGTYKLAVDRRRAIPFLQPKTYVVNPQDLRFSPTVVSYIGDPTEMTTKVGEQAKQAATKGGFLTKLWAVPYTAMRKVFFFEGVVRGYIKEEGQKEEQMLHLDTNGRKYKDFRDLFEVCKVDY